jgi:hypothetical protein
MMVYRVHWYRVNHRAWSYREFTVYSYTQDISEDPFLGLGQDQFEC